MPAFDFSKSKIREWQTPLPERPQAQYIAKSNWEHARLTVETLSLVRSPEASSFVWHRHKIECEPTFVVMMAHEHLAISLWARRSELGLRSGHLIVEESEWISSLRANEPYAGDPHIKINKYRNLVHYVLGGDNDFLHIICSEEPTFADCGFEPHQPDSERAMKVLQMIFGKKDPTEPASTEPGDSAKPKTRH